MYLACSLYMLVTEQRPAHDCCRYDKPYMPTNTSSPPPNLIVRMHQQKACDVKGCVMWYDASIGLWTYRRSDPRDMKTRRRRGWLST